MLHRLRNVVAAMSVLSWTFCLCVLDVNENFCAFSNEVQSNRELRLALFARARAEIGLPLLVTKPDSSIGNGFKGRERWESQSSFEDAFFLTLQGYSMANVSGVPVQYKRIWKCGNNDIRCTLWYLADENVSRLTETGLGHGALIDGKQRRKLDNGKIPRADIPLFTLVRDPIAHFNSGLREYIYRMDSEHKKMYNVAETRQWVTSVINATVPMKAIEIEHLTPIATQFRASHKHRILVGKLEYFQRDMLKIAQMLECPALESEYNGTTLETRCGHPTSNDPNGVGIALESLLREDARFLRALCWLHLADYICFDYSLPKECAGIGTESFKY